MARGTVKHRALDNCAEPGLTSSLAETVAPSPFGTIKEIFVSPGIAGGAVYDALDVDFELIQ